MLRVVLLVALLGGCSIDLDSIPRRDGAPDPIDAGLEDGGSSDGGAEDAGSIDGGVGDSGGGSDASAPDAG